MGALHLSTPVGGTNSDRNFFPMRSHTYHHLHNSDTIGSASRADLPQFDGSNLKLWQRRCEEQFQRSETPSHMWASYASDQFIGAAVTWLEAFLQQNQWPTWVQFTSTVLARFSRNQHQILVCGLFHIT